MYLKKPDPSAPLDEITLLAFDRFVANLAEFKAQRALDQALASDVYYECSYQLEWWQKLMFPVLSLRIRRLQTAIREKGLNAKKSVELLRKTVAILEFGHKVPPPHVRQFLRQEIVAQGYTHWQVRQAFNSRALTKVGDGLQFCPQPNGWRKLAVALQWISSIVSVLLLGKLLKEAAFEDPVIPGVDPFFVALQLCMLAATVFYVLGSQWHHGCGLMQRILPAHKIHC